jgi:hypothetical protein
MPGFKRAPVECNLKTLLVEKLRFWSVHDGVYYMVSFCDRTNIWCTSNWHVFFKFWTFFVRISDSRSFRYFLISSYSETFTPDLAAVSFISLIRYFDFDYKLDSPGSLISCCKSRHCCHLKTIEREHYSWWGRNVVRVQCNKASCAPLNWTGPRMGSHCCFT